MRLVLPLHILASIPLWALAPVFYLLTIGVIWVLRDWQEGLAYNVARSSQLGDAALFTIILMAVALLQDGRPVPPALNTWAMQVGILVIAAAVGYIWIKLDPTHRWGDRYHHLFVAPLLVYLGVNAAIIIFGAPPAYKVTAITLFAVWALLVLSDFAERRIDQRTYLQQQGIMGLKN